MKFRIGFVSNSSSSSFILAIDRLKEPQLFNLLESWCEHNCCYDTEIIAKGRDAILDYFVEKHPYEYADVEEIKEYSDTWDFIYMSCSNHDNVIRYYIDTPGVKIILSSY
jgi:hypothetical protein